MTQTRKSKKRDAIYALLQSTKAHPSAEWIYARLKGDIPDLSLGTVYRNLSLFREERSAVCVATVNGQDRFDGRMEPHAHFVCRVCGEVTDIADVDIPNPRGIGGTVEGCQLNYYGVCGDCGHRAAVDNDN